MINLYVYIITDGVNALYKQKKIFEHINQKNEFTNKL